MIRADAMGFLNDRMAEQVKDAACKLDLVHMTASPPIFDDMERTLAAIHRFNMSVRARNHDVTLVETRGDLKYLHKPVYNGTIIVRGLQHVPSDVDVSKLREAGIRIMQIGYQNVNPFGAGFAFPNVGITDRGEKLLDDMAENQIILDLSHASHKTAWTALHYISSRELPIHVMASHTGVYEVYNHPRNLTLDILAMITRVGGIVGLYTLTFGLHDTDNTVLPFIDHLQVLNSHFPDHAICFGTDGIHRTIDSEAQREQFEKLKALVDPDGHVRARYPDESFDLNLPTKIDTLMRLIYENVGIIKGIQGDNLLDFFSETLPE